MMMMMMMMMTLMKLVNSATKFRRGLTSFTNLIRVCAVLGPGRGYIYNIYIYIFTIEIYIYIQ